MSCHVHGSCQEIPWKRMSCHVHVMSCVAWPGMGVPFPSRAKKSAHFRAIQTSVNKNPRFQEPFGKIKFPLSWKRNGILFHVWCTRGIPLDAVTPPRVDAAHPFCTNQNLKGWCRSKRCEWLNDTSYKQTFCVWKNNLSTYNACREKSMDLQRKHHKVSTLQTTLY